LYFFGIAGRNYEGKKKKDMGGFHNVLTPYKASLINKTVHLWSDFELPMYALLNSTCSKKIRCITSRMHQNI